MELKDLTKEVQRLLLDHWSKDEIDQRLEDPEYFFEHVVNPRLEYLRRQGEPVGHIRLKRTPKGDLVILLTQ